MTDGSFRARDRMHCCTIQKKAHSACCECCVRAKCVPLKAAKSTCVAKRFVFMAIRPAQLSSRVNCEHNWNVKASESARRRVCDESQERQCIRRALAPKRASYAARGRAGSTDERACSRTWADRRHDDCNRLDDRVGHLYHLGGIIAIKRCTWVAASRLVSRRSVNETLRALLLGAGDHDAMEKERLCFSARSV